jgi:hypothetical protein
MPAAKREKFKSTKNARNARRLPTKCASFSFLWHLWHFLAKRQGTHRTRSRRRLKLATICNTKKRKLLALIISRQGKVGKIWQFWTKKGYA